MVKIDSRENITLTRGDDLTINYSIQDIEGNPYTLGKYDYIVFTVKEDADQKEPTFQIKVPNGSNSIEILSELHKNLPFGTYKYDIEVFLGNGKHYTPTAYKDFIISEEVGW